MRPQLFIDQIAFYLFLIGFVFWQCPLQAQTNTLDEGCFITEDGTIERLEMVRFKQQLRANKDSMLYAIRTESFNDLAAQAPLSNSKSYRYYTHYRFLQIGNLFSADKRHAVMIYLSDAFAQSDDEFRVNVHIFEITPASIHQVFEATQLSSYYRELAASITDLDGNGNNELLVMTSEPEWGSPNKPANEYYHRIMYDWASNSFTVHQGFEQLPNPIFLSPNYAYTYQTCGCGGDCWLSALYHQKDRQLQPIALLEDRCVGVGKLFAIEQQTKTLIAETLATDGRAAMPAFWKRYINDSQQTPADR